jgi:hypothetical protein
MVNCRVECWLVELEIDARFPSNSSPVRNIFTQNFLGLLMGPVGFDWATFLEPEEPEKFMKNYRDLVWVLGILEIP